MAPLSLASIIGTLGIAVHFGGAALLVVLFVLLGRYDLRRGYFTAWMTAWVAMAAAILWLVLRYNVLPRVLGGPPDDWSLEARALFFSYQLSKLVALLLFVSGVRAYVAGGRPVLVRLIAGLAGVYALASTALASDIEMLVVWQSPVAVASFAYCAAMLISLPASRRSLGSAVTGCAFAVLAALWSVYGVAFWVASHSTGVAPAWVESVLTFNSYLDFFVDVMLGYGMVVLLMEDGRREVLDAQAALRLAHDQLRRTAFLDPLTECHNRRAYDEGVGLELARTTFGTVLLADLDELKLVNDRFGHGGGDLLLRHCAKVLRDGLRPYDKLYRWGGDEFLLVMPSARAHDALARLDQVLDAAPALELEAGMAIRLRVSIGGAEYASTESMTAAIALADAEMYARKVHRKATPPTMTAIASASLGTAVQR